MSISSGATSGIQFHFVFLQISTSCNVLYYVIRLPCILYVAFTYLDRLNGQHVDAISLFFSQKTCFDISWKLSLMEINGIIYLNMFSGKNKKTKNIKIYLKMSSDEFFSQSAKHCQLLKQVRSTASKMFL